MRQPAVLSRRSGGVLLHPTSLPGPFGIGDLGPSAFAFVDFLASARQRWWQMLPIGPVGLGHSPYTALSSFAGFPLLISIESLARDGLLPRRFAKRSPASSPSKANYHSAFTAKLPLLHQAFENFERKHPRALRIQFEAFRRRERSWLADWSLFMALRDAHSGVPWNRWDWSVRVRQPQAMKHALRDLADDVRFHEFVQFQFFRQWTALRDYAHRRDVYLIGDLPMFVAADSADVWSHPELFELHRDGSPRLVAGVPPDYFSRTGQLWGNPVYRWSVHRKTHFRWWNARMRSTLANFDAVRLDHFIGLLRCWAVPGNHKTAIRGHWRPGPAAHLLSALERALGQLPVIAEDLGVVTPQVKKLRDDFHLPGMKVLQFAFGNDPEAAAYKPHAYPNSCFAYTGTHDNDTVVGWFRDTGSTSSTRSAREIRAERSFALRYLDCDGREIHWHMIHAVWASPANVAVVPVQDLLGLGSEARMNRPGVEEGNWGWRLPSFSDLQKIQSRLRSLTEIYDRA